MMLVITSDHLLYRRNKVFIRFFLFAAQNYYKSFSRITFKNLHLNTFRFANFILQKKKKEKESYNSVYNSI